MPTAAPRVLPWRRTAPAEPSLEPLLRTFRIRHPKGDADLIRRAYLLARDAHAGQQRLSGEDYVEHPLAVAKLVAGIGLDNISIAAALLHDAVEDTEVDIERVEREFGEQVAALVDGVTKLDRVRFESKEAAQAASLRKMLVAMAKDWRVLVVKLADRLHNMRTLAVMPRWKQERTANETLEVYAPLAHRLGMQEVKWQLEDLAFATLHPRRYAEIDAMVATRDPEREIYLDQVLEQVRDRLSRVRIEADVTGRPKHLYSIYEKMVVKHREFDEIFDLVGIRVLVDKQADCWSALGAIHSTWRPIDGRFKDYINTPKFNLYQSIHTTVVGPQGKPLECQIRTREMHRRAEYGVAAHWGYKEGSPSNDPAWLKRMADMEAETSDPIEFMETLKLDLEQDEVYVFTPKGDVMALPTGATPVDFAYSVHTDVGHRCIGAKVNGRLATLDSVLQSGDTIEIFTAKVPTAAPSRDWLQFVVTPRARNKIRQWFSRERRSDAIDNGRDELLRAMRKENLPVQRMLTSPLLTALSDEMSYVDLESLFAAIGEGHASAQSISQRLARDLRGGDHEEQLPASVRRPRRSAGRQTGIYVEGLDDMMVRLSRCCTPVPGDEIVGFVTQGRGVSVHRSDCANAVALSSGSEGRMIEVEWDRERPSTFVASIEVKALDRARLLADVTRILAEHHVNILTSTSHAGNDRVSKMRFEFELADAAHLESLLASLKRVDGVYDAYRLLPGGGATRERAANGTRRPAPDGPLVEGAAPDASPVPEAASAAASSSDPGE